MEMARRLRIGTGPAWSHDPGDATSSRTDESSAWRMPDARGKGAAMAEVPPELMRARRKWTHVGRVRPPWAEPAGPGRISVWDFPRPPRIEPLSGMVRVEFAGRVVAETRSALRVLETASPPTVYVPARHVQTDALTATEAFARCEWKGEATHFSLRVAERESRDAAWSYRDPFPEFDAIRGYFAFYPARVDHCWLEGERVGAQPGSIYGGWVTRELVGPFKGAPGTEDW
jgi:uncharacterized protein (DUF427 family)